MDAIKIERRLKEKDLGVRLEFAKRTDFTPTTTQIERGLTDKAPWVRRAFAERTDFTPTPEQIERGLMDNSPTIRTIFAAKQAEWLREQFQSMTPQKIKKVL